MATVLSTTRHGDERAARDPALARLARLVGRWEISGPLIAGEARFEWTEDGRFLVQRVEIAYGGRTTKGVERIGFDEETGTLRSRYADDHGNTFAYTWDLDGDLLYVWFGDRDSETFLRARFDATGDRYVGRWQWPEPDGRLGGYEVRGARR